MSFLSLMEAKLPPGFRFQPRDEELVLDYLAKKVAGNDALVDSSFDCFPTIVEIDLNKIEPWDLPEMACVGGKEWYFFSLRDRKYATGPRTNRATISGYWKATGKDRQVMDIQKRALVGMRKTLVFYQGRAPKGKNTDWVMHEFRLEGRHGRGHLPNTPSQEDWVLCRVFYKKRGLIMSAAAKASSCCDQEIMINSSSSCDVEDQTSCYSFSLPPLMDTSGSFRLPFDDHDHHSTNSSSTPLLSSSLDGLLIPQVPCFSNSVSAARPPNYQLMTLISEINDPLTNVVPLVPLNSQSVLAEPNNIPSTDNNNNSFADSSASSSTSTHDHDPLLIDHDHHDLLASNSFDDLVDHDQYPLWYEKEVIRAVLDHFNKMESSSSNNNNRSKIMVEAHVASPPGSLQLPDHDGITTTTSAADAEGYLSAGMGGLSPVWNHEYCLF